MKSDSAARRKSLIISFAKILLVGGMLAYLIKSDKLHLSELGVYIQKPEFLACGIAFWLICIVLLGAYRWYLLLRGLGITPTFSRALKLHMIGLFFNVAMPGAIGGDIVKAIYIVRDDQRPASKTPAMLSVLLDRVLGLLGLFTIAAFAMIANFTRIAESPTLRSLATPLVVLIFGAAVFVCLVFAPYDNDRDPLHRLFSLRIPLMPTVRRVYEALRSLRFSPLTFFMAWLCGIIVQLGAMGFYYYASVVVAPTNSDLAAFVVVFPIGSIASVIPLLPGGMGVGHVAFEKLYQIVGLSNGANVFNIVMVLTLALNLLGFIPYLLLKSKNGQRIDLTDVAQMELKP